MPLREDLLQPIAEENPAGTSLRYDRIYDQIKEARTEEDSTLDSGVWQRQAKRADFRLAAKLAGEALATRSKDLQLAAWLGEALLKTEGIQLLPPVLQLLLDLQLTFWDTMYPEIDEGDAGMRAVPLQWAATRYAALVHSAPLTRRGVSFVEYTSARAIGTLEDASNSEAKREKREEAVAAGKITSEEVDEAIAETPKAFYASLEAALASGMEVLAQLDTFCEERYGDDSPSFRKLREALAEVHNLVSAQLRAKREVDPDPTQTPELEEEPEAVEDAGESLLLDEQTTYAEEPRAFAPPTSAAAREPARRKARTAEPESWEDALSRIDEAASYMQAHAPESPLPFLLRSAMRLAELREAADAGQMEALAAPATELRQELRRAASEGEWSTVHTQSLAALQTTCGRAWLDLYRYLWTSGRELGFPALQHAVTVEVQQRLREFPELTQWTLNDDTPTANPETQRWLREEIAPPQAEEHEEAEPPTPVTFALPEPAHQAADSEAPGVLANARALADAGHFQAAIQLLARDLAQEPVGRLRFGRNLEIAALCVESGNTAVAVPLLQSLVREVEDRRLESWEPVTTAARPYTLLLSCASSVKLETQPIFARLCAIDPSAALMVSVPVEG